MPFHPRALVLLFAVALVGGCGQKKPPPPPTPTVTVAQPLSKRIVDWDDYVGRFEAVQSVQVRARVSGYLQSVAFKDGEMVRAGQLLFVIDPRPFQAALDQAKGDEAKARAALDLSKADLARAGKLLAARAISQQDLDTAKAAVEQNAAALTTAQANVRTQALNLSFTRVAAPISGRVSDRKVDAGNLVNGGGTGGDVLTTIVSVDPMYFGFEGSEALYLKYQRLNRAGARTSSRYAANPVDIRLQDETQYRWHGRMDFVDNALDPGSGTIRGRAVVRNPDGFLSPGLFGHMRLLGSGAYQGLLIPDEAVVADEARRVVYVVGADGKVLDRPVELGPLVDGLRVVKSGVNAEDRIVIAGLQKAQPGKPVKTVTGKIVPPEPGTSPDTAQMVSFPPVATATTAPAR